MADDRSEANKLRDQIAAAEKVRGAVPRPLTREELNTAAHQRFEPLWAALTEYNDVVRAKGHSVDFTFTKVDVANVIVDGQITFRAGGSRTKVHEFKIQGQLIVLPDFKHTVDNRQIVAWNTAELDELKDRVRADLASFVTG